MRLLATALIALGATTPALAQELGSMWGTANAEAKVMGLTSRPRRDMVAVERGFEQVDGGRGRRGDGGRDLHLAPALSSVWLWLRRAGGGHLVLRGGRGGGGDILGRGCGEGERVGPAPWSVGARARAVKPGV